MMMMVMFPRLKREGSGISGLTQNGHGPDSGSEDGQITGDGEKDDGLYVHDNGMMVDTLTNRRCRRYCRYITTLFLHNSRSIPTHHLTIVVHPMMMEYVA